MVLDALNSAVAPAPVVVPGSTTTMQYTYQSLIEVGLSILMLPTLKLTILNATAYKKRNGLLPHIIPEYHQRIREPETAGMTTD
jgi:hypothetical protein